MKLRETLDTYMFDNVGQFGGIAESLGYQTEYRDGYFRFRKDGEEFSMSVGEIREKARAKRMRPYVSSPRNGWQTYSTRNVPMIRDTWQNWKKRVSASNDGKT